MSYGEYMHSGMLVFADFIIELSLKVSESCFGIPEVEFRRLHVISESIREITSWEQRKLGELATFTKGAGYSKSDLKESGTPVVLYGRLYTKYETVIRDVDTFVDAKDGSIYSRGGEVVVPASGETAEDIAIASTLEKSGILIGGDLNVIHPCNRLEPVFLAISISNGEPHVEMARRAQGKSVVHLHNEDLSRIELQYPEIAEQQKISQCFLNLDHLITLHQRECERLQMVKKSMLENCFPKNGEKVPRFRFAGFTGDWEQRKLGEYLEVSTEKNTSDIYGKEDVLSVSGDYGIVNQIEFQGRSFAGASVSNYGVVHIGDIVYTKSPLSSNPYGIIKTNKGKTGIVSTLYAVYHPQENTCADFVQTYFEQHARMNNYMHPLVNKGAKNDMKVSAENALKGIVSFPKLEEQKAISEMFSVVDHIITLHQSKLEMLKKIKESMLGKMLV